MSHVTALPSPAHSGISGGIDETVEAAHHALSQIFELKNTDVMDTTVGVVSVLALARYVYILFGRPKITAPLSWVYTFAKSKID